MTQQLTQPQPAGFTRDPNAPMFKIREHVGRLILVSNISYKTGLKIGTEVKDGIAADVVVLDGPNAPIEYPDALILQRALIGSLRKSEGSIVLGRAGTLPPQPGQSAAFALLPYAEADAAVAQAYLDRPKPPRTFAQAAPIDSAGPAPTWAPPVQQQAPQAPAPQAAAPVPAPQQVNTTTGEVTGGGQVAVKMQDGNVIMVDAATAQAIKNLPGATILG